MVTQATFVRTLSLIHICVGFSSQGFINPQTFDLRLVLEGTAIACFSFIGFDAITTLAEDVKEPSKTLPKSIIMTCLVMAAIFVVLSWLAQNLYPSFEYTNPCLLDTSRCV